jgi:hypothetical protein
MRAENQTKLASEKTRVYAQKPQPKMPFKNTFSSKACSFSPDCRYLRIYRGRKRPMQCKCFTIFGHQNPRSGSESRSGSGSEWTKNARSGTTVKPMRIRNTCLNNTNLQSHKSFYDFRLDFSSLDHKALGFKSPIISRTVPGTVPIAKPILLLNPLPRERNLFSLT